MEEEVAALVRVLALVHLPSAPFSPGAPRSLTMVPECARPAVRVFLFTPLRVFPDMIF